MNREGPVPNTIPRRNWEFAAPAVVAVATGVAVLLAYLLLDPPARDLIDLGLYLAVAGAVAIAGCWAVIRWLERWSALGLLGQAILVALIGSATSITTILILARLMFISSDHDLQVLLAVSAFTVIMTVFCTTWLTSSTLARLLVVARGIRELAAGDLEARAAVPGADEVAALASDVNALALRLGEARAERIALDRERRDLTASISHDLRTPLSTIRAMVDALDDGVVSDTAGMKRYFVTIRRDIERLDRMIDDLFELAQMDAGALRLQRDHVALHEIVGDVVSAMRPRAEQAGLTLDLVIAGERPVVYEIKTDLDGLGRLDLSGGQQPDARQLARRVEPIERRVPAAHGGGQGDHVAGVADLRAGGEPHGLAVDRGLGIGEDLEFAVARVGRDLAQALGRDAGCLRERRWHQGRQAGARGQRGDPDQGASPGQSRAPVQDGCRTLHRGESSVWCAGPGLGGPEFWTAGCLGQLRRRGW